MTTKKWKSVKMNPNGTVFIGIPRERVMYPQFSDNLIQIMMALKDRLVAYHNVDGHRVDKNRDGIVKAFLEHPGKPEWLLMLDTDMDFPPNIATRLTAHAKPIIGALYFHRGKAFDPFAFKYAGLLEDEYGRSRPAWTPMRDEVYNFLIENNVPNYSGSFIVDNCNSSPLVEVDAVATGGMVIHRSVLEFMPKPIFEYRPLAISEDLQFCLEAKEAGIDVWCDLSTVCGHYRPMPMGHNEFKNSYLNRGIALSTYSVQNMSAWIAGYLNISGKAAQEMIEKGTAHMVGAYWDSQKPATAEEEEKFYQDPYTGRLYLIELAHWNSTPVFKSIRLPLVETRGKRVMILGAGIGTTAIQMAIQKNIVHAVEINNTLANFINYRIDQLQKLLSEPISNLVVDNGTAWYDFENEFDLIIAIDVLEHIPQPGIQEVLSHINKALKSDGSLYYHANFKQQDLYPMHHDYSENWSKWMIEAGLKEVSPYAAVKA